ncbi:hypothetical protein FJU30_16965 [Affinibrenneria salicis]|uniref:Uncharacterized protein n=1 Tax=Affinibrenneria salicis TaxID=2590031 RepID=A0A5J5FW58_9GAMM|nr:hypothetical protein [Affinibrenneria salicis]KAA8998109.1 hypothetical protein FJU30_16965 [Affinibrenneria salicis]
MMTPGRNAGYKLREPSDDNRIIISPDRIVGVAEKFTTKKTPAKNAGVFFDFALLFTRFLTAQARAVIAIAVSGPSTSDGDNVYC